MNLDVVVLAAGKGTRMKSGKAKVLHELAGKNLLSHVLDTAQQLKPRQIAVVVGHQAEAIQQSIAEPVVWVNQAEQLGTGHAVQLGCSALAGDGVVLVLYGDVPLINHETLMQCCAVAEAGGVGLVTAQFADPAELGRIIRGGSGQIEEIVEYKDATAQQRDIAEINSGILAAPAVKLTDWLARIEPNNAQRELYLTDVIALAVADSVAITGVTASSATEVTGVNDREQLAQLERWYQYRQAQRLMLAGVTIADPQRLDIRGQVTAGQDCYLDVNVVLCGEVSLGTGVSVGAGVVITDSIIGDHSEIHPHTVVEGASVAKNCSLGPFARIRPGTVLDDGVKIGNFVETKKAHLGAGTKAGHLAYLGDVQLGNDCNVGAGTVTCNYDGVDKHRTEIGNDVFVGTNSTLVAPIVVDDGAFIAAGSTVTSKVGKGDLAVGRAKQRNITGWVRPDQRKNKR